MSSLDHDPTPGGLTWDAPLDVEAEVARVPDDATVKGIFPGAVAELLRMRGHPWATRYFPTTDYPLVDHLHLLVTAANALHGDVPIREGLRRLGRSAYPAFVETMLGRVLFGVLGDDVRALFRVVEKAYRVATRPGGAVLEEIGDDHAVVRLSSIYAFLDTYQVGVLEGVILACFQEPTVTMQRLSPVDARFVCRWRAPHVPPLPT